ncbi:hypothetical protein VPHK469_0182 [Vibrio phage K469]
MKSLAEIKMGWFNFELWCTVKFINFNYNFCGGSTIRPEVIELYRDMVLTDTIKFSDTHADQLIDFRLAKLKYYHIYVDGNSITVKVGYKADNCCMRLFNDAEECLIAKGANIVKKANKAKKDAQRRAESDKSFNEVFRK